MKWPTLASICCMLALPALAFAQTPAQTPTTKPNQEGRENGECRCTGFSSSYPVQARRETKIAWRVGGSGPITFLVVSPTGRVVQPLWGSRGYCKQLGSARRRVGDGLQIPDRWMLDGAR